MLPLSGLSYHASCNHKLTAVSTVGNYSPCTGHNIKQSDERIVCRKQLYVSVIGMYLVNAAVKNVGLTSHSLCNAEHIVCSCVNKRTENFIAVRLEQINIFFCTIVVALNGQPDFFMKITIPFPSIFSFPILFL